MPMRVAFLGPEGTYGERAARSLMKLEDIENPVLVACSGLRSVVEHVADGRCESAVVPVENSVEGGVTAILDALWSYSNLRIRRAVVLPIRHALLSRSMGQFETAVRDVNKRLDEIQTSTQAGMSQLHHQLGLLQAKMHFSRAFNSANVVLGNAWRTTSSAPSTDSMVTLAVTLAAPSATIAC